MDEKAIRNQIAEMRSRISKLTPKEVEHFKALRRKVFAIQDENSKKLRKDTPKSQAHAVVAKKMPKPTYTPSEKEKGDHQSKMIDEEQDFLKTYRRRKNY